MKKFIPLVRESEIESLINRVEFKNFESSKVLITGGTGLIGAYLTITILECCKQLGINMPEITVTSKSGNFERFKNYSDRDFLKVAQTDIVESIPRGPFNIVIHAASPASPTKYESFSEIRMTNFEYLKAIIANQSSLETILFISSGEVYGSNAPNPVPENYIGFIEPSGSRSAYPLAKIDSERLLLENTNNSFEKRIVRLFHSYGPGIAVGDGRSFSDFVSRGSKGMPPALHSNGRQVRTFSYLEDSIAGILTVLFSKCDTPVNVGSSKAISILDFAKKVSEISGLHGQIEFIGKPDLYVESPNDVIVPNVSLLKSLGWRELISLEEGILRTVEWMRFNR